MKAGTLARLVDALASDTGELESTYINVFLATYRTFASAKQVLNLLTERSVFIYSLMTGWRSKLEVCDKVRVNF